MFTNFLNVDEKDLPSFLGEGAGDASAYALRRASDDGILLCIRHCCDIVEGG